MKSFFFKLALSVLALNLFVAAEPIFAYTISQATLQSTDPLKSAKPTTNSVIVLMPVMDKTGGSVNLANFGTEILNQSFLNGGISVIPWFKMESLMKLYLAKQNPYISYSSANLLSDDKIMDIIKVSKKAGASYILRPILLTKSTDASITTSQTGWGVLFGSRQDAQLSVNAQVGLKVDIIDAKTEQIIGSKTFNGRSSEITKERANQLDGIVGQQIFTPGSEQDSYRSAFYDTIDKVLDFLLSKLK